MGMILRGVFLASTTAVIRLEGADRNAFAAIRW